MGCGGDLEEGIPRTLDGFRTDHECGLEHGSVCTGSRGGPCVAPIGGACSPVEPQPIPVRHVVETKSDATGVWSLTDSRLVVQGHVGGVDLMEFAPGEKCIESPFVALGGLVRAWWCSVM